MCSWAYTQEQMTAYARKAVSAALAAAQAEQAKPMTVCERCSGEGAVSDDLFGQDSQCPECEGEGGFPTSPPSDRGPAGTPPPVEQGAAVEDCIYDLLTKLASVDTHDQNLRDHKEAWDAAETFARYVMDIAADRAPPQADRADAERLEEVGLQFRSRNDAGHWSPWEPVAVDSRYLLAMIKADPNYGEVRPIYATRATQEPKP
jgi:hypothetical protein